MHPLHAIGLDKIVENTNRVRSVLSGTGENEMPEDVCRIRTSMLDRYDQEFINQMMTMFERISGKTFPKRDSLYQLLASEPFIGVVLEEDRNGSGYPVGVPLIVAMSGNDGLIKPDGNVGGVISKSIRLATDEELIHLAGMVQ